MYDSSGTYHFMNIQNYDQIEMEEEALGDNAPWMQPGMKIQAEFYDGKPIGVRLPNSMTLTIVETNPRHEDGDEDREQQAGEAGERGDGERSRVRGDGRPDPRQPVHRRVHRAGEGLRAGGGQPAPQARSACRGARQDAG